MKPFQIGLYSVFLNVPSKHVQEKEKGKEIFISTSIATLKNEDNDFLCQLCSLTLYLFWLTACIFDFFYLNTRHDHELKSVKH